MNLNQLRQAALHRVFDGMNLRRPQKEALQAFHDIHRTLTYSLAETTHQQIVNRFKETNPSWQFSGGVTEIDFSLATGVGKTRLIGAVLAYLFLAGESKHFVIVTPRAEIVRKFLKETRAVDTKYIFYDSSVLDTPDVIYADNIENFDPQQQRLNDVPIVWIITPQALAVKNSRLKQVSEYGDSPVSHLKSLSDLVIFFDESHHLGADKKDPSIWRQEVRNLTPKYIFGTSASLDLTHHSNIIYSYPLVQALNEHLYTKQVQVIPSKRDKQISDEDFDKITLRFGLERLEVKRRSLQNFAGTTSEIFYKKKGVFKPVMLVCCDDKAHAETISDWLKEILGSEEKVLLVHSGLKESEYLPMLLAIESPENRVEVVVNVAMLSEGWDVANVYVIAPLRKMASITMATQVMGRGLRLPYGEQVGDDEVDTLDLLCFGSESLQAICDELLSKGYGVGAGTGIQVIPSHSEDLPKPDDILPPKPYQLTWAFGPKSLDFDNLSRERPQLDLDKVNVPPVTATEIHTFRIHDPRTVRALRGRPGYPRDYFVAAVLTGLLRACRSYLSAGRHSESGKRLVERFLAGCGYNAGEISLEPEKVIAHLKERLDELKKSVTAKYSPTGEVKSVNLTDLPTIFVPHHFKVEISSFSINTRQHWNAIKAKGIPISGWKRSVFLAIPFDQPNELKIAKAIDSSESVQWWFRNLPHILKLDTPAGSYSPDFAMLLKIGDVNVLLEVKGDEFQLSDKSDSSIKKEAAIRWCKAMSEATKTRWQYWFLLDSDAEICDTFADIQNYAEKS